MEWFKHKTASHDDPDIADCEDIYGDAGYTIFFKLLEIYGQEYNHLQEGWLNVSQTFVRRKLRKTWTKVEQVLNFYKEKNRISYTIDVGRLIYKVPNFIELASNWTKRQEATTTEVSTEAPTAIEVEEEVEEEKKEHMFITFWNRWHLITKLPKTDMQAAKKYFSKLTKAEKEKALSNIQPYFDSLKDPQYCKKARTYLRDKNFNDEFRKAYGIV